MLKTNKNKILIFAIVFFILCGFVRVNASSYYVDNGGFVPENETNYIFEGTLEVVSVNEYKFIQFSHLNLACSNIQIVIVGDNITFDEERYDMKYFDTKLNYIKDMEYYEYSPKKIVSANYSDDCIYYLGYIGVVEASGFDLTNENVYENIYVIASGATLDEDPYFDRSGFRTDEAFVYLYTNIDYMYPKSMVEGNVFAFDNVDGDISEKINFNYNNLYENLDKTGEFLIEIDVDDSSYNQQRSQIKVIRKDCIAPIIILTDRIVVEPNPSNSSDIIFDYIELYDNHTNPENISIEIIHDGLIGHETSFGQFTVEVEITDESGNSHIEPIDIHIEDLTPPVIEGPESITVNVDKEWTEDEFKEQFNVYDEVQGEITDFVFESTYFENTNKPGTYNFVVKVYDEYKNFTSKPGVVRVVDTTPPVFYYGNIYSDYNGYAWRGLDCVIDYLGQTDVTVLTNLSSLQSGTNNVTYLANGEVGSVKVTLVENLYDSLGGTKSINRQIKETMDNFISWLKK